MGKKIVLDWRPYIDCQFIEGAEKDEEKGITSNAWVSEDGLSGKLSYLNKYFASVSLPETYLEVKEGNFYHPYTWYGFTYPFRFKCTCKRGSDGYPCRHVTCLLLHLEKLHGGPFIFEETQEEEQYEKEKAEKEAEERRQEELREKLKNDIHPIEDYTGIPNPSLNLYFDLHHMVQNYKTNAYEIKKANDIANKSFSWAKFKIIYSSDGHQHLRAEANVQNNEVSFELSQNELSQCHCSCGHTLDGKKRMSYFTSNGKTDETFFCNHALIVWKKIIHRIEEENPGDETSSSGDKFLSLFAKESLHTDEVPEAEDEAIILNKNIDLYPRIVDEGDAGLCLGFLIRRQGEKDYVMKNTLHLPDAIENKNIFTLTKRFSIDFSKEQLTDASQVWLEIIERVQEEYSTRRNRVSWNRPAPVMIGENIILKNSLLDRVYNLLKGQEVPYLTENEIRSIYFQHKKVTIYVKIAPEEKAHVLQAVTVTGNLPRILKGRESQYMVTDNVISRIEADDRKALAPYQQLFGNTDFFTVRIGTKHLADLYYRILPAMRESGNVELSDQTGDLANDYLPAEAQFTFFLDLEDDIITCRGEVKMGDAVHTLLQHAKADPSTDYRQEDRIADEVAKFFPKFNAEKSRFENKNNDTILPWILLYGVNTLSRYGVVKGSDRFQNIHIKRFEPPRVSISLSSGLLDLSIKTKDIDEEELLDILNSYKQRKKWHRLRSGDYVSLEDSKNSLDEFTGFTDALGVSPKEALEGTIEIPRYRAVYIDKLLEEHDQLAASRDRAFKSLIRSFRTIQDADYEVPKEVSDILRPYQLYGYRWLRTLEANGFGGILADEMGLGKTLQMLSTLLGMKQDGEKKPSLIICPASLVYNWKEEAKKFTPSLSTTILAGTKSERKQLMEALKEGAGTDVYITSYDTLKRDVVLYDNVSFAAIVLDEAQFAKNQNAQVTKAIKTLKASARFALTGTPIENRLSELWSIFDFLMPGFLYTASEFRERFETPIMKNNDASAKEILSKMTKPFILRRKKEEVLKDLPEKLEEVQTAVFSEEQQKLYDAEVVRIKRLIAEKTDNSGESRFKILAGITRLREICCDPSLLFENYTGESAKREACLELIERAIDGGHRMLLFSQFTSMLDLLKQDLDDRNIRYYEITGATDKKLRLELVDKFNTDDTPVFLISLRAGGTGLNLTGADIVIHYDPWWNVAVMNQATDRAHRIGQTKKVNVVKLVASGTIEEKIMNLQKAKAVLADEILSEKGDSLAALSDDEILSILN